MYLLQRVLGFKYRNFPTWLTLASLNKVPSIQLPKFLQAYNLADFLFSTLGTQADKNPSRRATYVGSEETPWSLQVSMVFPSMLFFAYKRLYNTLQHYTIL